jgi:hypothetical protein
MQSEQTNELSAALAVAQGAMKAATFNKINPHFKNRYADLAAVVDAIRGPLASNGLSYTQTTEIREGGFVLVTTLRHASGQWVASEYPLPAGAKPQELGSALTYARRYSLSAIACIAADDDDDAEGARKTDQTSSTPAARANPHVTRPEDLSDAKPRHDERGNRIDWIDTSEHRVERLSKAKARPVADLLNKDMRTNTTAQQLVEWGADRAEQVASLPADWEEIFQSRYQEFLDELRAKQPRLVKPEPDNLLQAG